MPSNCTWLYISVYSRKLRGQKLFANWQKIRFCKETGLADCSLVSPPKDPMPPNFAEKTFANSYKTLKVFAKKVSSYMVLLFVIATCCLIVCSIRTLGYTCIGLITTGLVDWLVNPSKMLDSQQESLTSFRNIGLLNFPISSCSLGNVSKESLINLV